MKPNKTPLSGVRANEQNPRTISDGNKQLLINSILEFPKMLELRPIVTDADGKILGGNMRHRALLAIAGMSAEEINARIASLRSSQRKTEDEVRKLTSFWLEWIRGPFAFVLGASALTAEEKEAFVIKDNVNFGQWDWDALDNFSQEDLQDWGVQTWGSLQPLAAPGNTPEPATTAAADNRERIIIIFPREKREEVERLLKLPAGKSVYRINELINGEER